MSHALRAEAVSWEVGGARIVDDVTLSVDYGAVLALVGPNGAGKSTLFSLLTGDMPPSAGQVFMDERPVSQWSPRDRARRRAVLTQENIVSFPFRVREVVAMGRTPWRGLSQSVEDAVAIHESLTAMDVPHLAHRTFTSLSGGEKARVSLARVLAQRTDIVLLDEPTAALDLRHQEDIMMVARRLAHEGKAVAVVLHDLALAAAYADQVAIMSEGRLECLGPPREVMTPQRLREVYGIEVRVMEDPHSRSPLIVPVRDTDKPLNL